MLPTELLVVKVGRNWIRPRFVYLNDDSSISLAEELILLFNEGVGKKKRFIIDKVRDLESIWDYKLVRGLAHLLERRCEFERKGVINPIEARRMIFTKKGVLKEEDRSKIIREKAKELGVKEKDLEESLWCDLEEELFLKKFNIVKPRDLLALYNLSLAQTLLFHSINLRFTVSSETSSKWKTIIRKAKYLGLMYIAEYVNNKVYINFDGPLSIFKMNERYGTSLAKLLPIIIQSDYWHINANVVRKGLNGSKKLLKFDLDSIKAKDIIEPLPLFEEAKEESFYDSKLEEDFARSFRELGTSWILKREPEPIIAGNSLLIPDFSFEKGKIKVYFEIVGFWTQDYIKRKMEKLKKVKEQIIVAVNEELYCSEEKLSQTINGLIHKVILFKRRIPLNQIISCLKDIERRKVRIEVESYKKDLKLKRDVVKLEELAEKEKISIEAIREIVKEKAKDYIIIGNDVVSIKRINELKKLDFSNLTLNEVHSIIKDIRDINNLLNYLGYSVKWLSLNEAKIVRKDDSY